MNSLFAFLLFGMVGRAHKERLDVSVLRLGMYVSHWIGFCNIFTSLEGRCTRSVC